MRRRAQRSGSERAGDDRHSRIERIAKRAYEIYEARGGTGGRELDDWLQAEREIDAADATAPSPLAPESHMVRGV